MYTAPDMIIGIPKEIKPQEYRVGGTPQMVRLLAGDGHKVLVETGAGEAIGFSDEAYLKNGAIIAVSAEEVYKADCIVKVKEPQTEEVKLLRRGQLLFCYLHLAASRALTEALIKSGVIAIAYETVSEDGRSLPLLQPMSEIAGRLAATSGATYLQMNYGGKGMLIGGVPGVSPAHVVILGGGVAGTEVARMAVGLGASVTILDTSLDVLRRLDLYFGSKVTTLYSAPSMIDEVLPTADLVVGAVLLPGKRAPKLITRAHLKEMEKGSVFVDIAIDQGGCAETSRPTTHLDPTFVEEGVVHYCVANMPGATPRTATMALTNATTPYVRQLLSHSLSELLSCSPAYVEGMNLCLGQVTHKKIAEEFSLPYFPPIEAIKL